MDLRKAINQMLAAVTAMDASRRQVNGILTWRDFTDRVTRHAGCSVNVPRFAVTNTHRRWRDAADVILQVLAHHSAAADAAIAAAARRAEEAEQRAEQAAARAAAASGQEGQEGEAAAAAAEARAARSEAATARGEEAAARHWLIAALEAHDYGRRLVANENSIALPVGDALAMAGGTRQVPSSKHYFNGDARRAVTVRGGRR